MAIEEKLNEIRRLRTDRDNATRELRGKVMEIEREIDAISEPYDEKIEVLTKEIETEIITSGEQFENENVKIFYSKGYVVEPSISIKWKHY